MFATWQPNFTMSDWMRYRVPVFLLKLVALSGLAIASLRGSAPTPVASTLSPAPFNERSCARGGAAFCADASA